MVQAKASLFYLFCLSRSRFLIVTESILLLFSFPVSNSPFFHLTIYDQGSFPTVMLASLVWFECCENVCALCSAATV